MGSNVFTNLLLFTLIVIQVWIHLHRFPFLSSCWKKIVDFLSNYPTLFLIGWLPAAPALWIGPQNIELVESEFWKGLIAMGLVLGGFVVIMLLWSIVLGLWSLAKNKVSKS